MAASGSAWPAAWRGRGAAVRSRRATPPSRRRRSPSSSVRRQGAPSTADVTARRGRTPGRATCAALGRLDILVNNAGINIRKPPETTRVAEWHTVMDTNLTGAFLCSQAAYPEMKAAGGGKIINIGSMMSIFGAPLRVGLCREQGRHRAAHQGAGHRLGRGQHPGQRGAAGLDRHRPDRARAPQVAGLHERCWRARRPAAGACPTIWPGSRCSWPAPASDFVTGTAIPGRRRLFGQG